LFEKRIDHDAVWKHHRPRQNYVRERDSANASSLSDNRRRRGARQNPITIFAKKKALSNDQQHLLTSYQIRNTG